MHQYADEFLIRFVRQSLNFRRLGLLCCRLPTRNHAMSSSRGLTENVSSRAGLSEKKKGNSYYAEKIQGLQQQTAALMEQVKVEKAAGELLNVKDEILEV